VLYEELRRLDQDEITREDKMKDEIKRKRTEEAQAVDPECKAEIQAQIQRLEDENAHQFSQFEALRASQLLRIASFNDGSVP
jgi:hypothetical protein